MNTILYINKLKINVILIFIFSVNFTLAQSYRGLSVLSENEIWASGSKGTVIHTLNGGTSFDTLSPKGSWPERRGWTKRGSLPGKHRNRQEEGYQ